MKPSLDFDRLALVTQMPDALATAARLVAINALAAEGAARRHELPDYIERMRQASAALDEAREIVRLAGRVAA
jgi:hypothetical protein